MELGELRKIKTIVLAVVLGMTVVMLTGCRDKGRLVKPKDGPAHVLMELREFHFGTVYQSQSTVSHDFLLINDGSELLVINSVENLCHCTQVDYSKEPIRPGHGRKLKVILNLNELTPGFFSRTVVVHTNAGDVSIDVKGELK